jgi:hypothetical protein
MSIFEPTLEYLAREWIKTFKKAPVITAILSVIVGIVTSTGIYYAGHSRVFIPATGNLLIFQRIKNKQ